MISLLNASAFRSERDEDRSKTLTPEECQSYLAQYASSKIRLWKYNCSLSRLVLRVERPADGRLLPIDLVFVALSDIRCPVHWTLGASQIRDDRDSCGTTFEVLSAGVSLLASDLTIVVHDEYPHRYWELGD